MFTEYTEQEVRELVNAVKKPKTQIRAEHIVKDKKVDVNTIDVKSLAKQGSVRRFEENSILFREGDDGTDMYLILQGKVDVLHKDNVVASLEVGDMFGEMSLVDTMPRSATIRVSETLSALVLSRSNFNSVISTEPNIAFRVMQTLSKRIRLMNQTIFMLKNKGEEEATDILEDSDTAEGITDDF